MKKILIVIGAFIIATGNVQAQDTLRKKDTVKTQSQKKSRMHKEDHLMFHNGKLYQMKEGTRTEVQAPVKLNDGTLINPDGTYEKDGRQMKLEEGECMDMNGSRYKSQMMFNKRKMMDHKDMGKKKMPSDGGKKPMPQK